MAAQAALALVAAAAGLLVPLAAAIETVPVDCQAPLWANLPLAKQHTPADDYNPSSLDYYHDWMLKHVLPPFVFSCIAAALLLAFLLWRLARLAACTRCLRGPRLRGAAAGKLLAARSTRWLRAAVLLLAAAVVAGAGYGFSTIQPHLQPAGVAVYDDTKAYVADGLAAANATLAATRDLQGQLASIRQRALDLGLEQLQPGLLETVAEFGQRVDEVADGLGTATNDIQTAVLNRLQRLQSDWQPLADRLDVVRTAALYACFSLVIAAAVGVAAGVLLPCPGLARGCLGALLAFILLAWAAVAASTAGLKLGSDGCMVVETKVIDALVAAAERQKASGEGVLAGVGVGGTLALARYYFYGVGKSPSEVLYDLTGLDVPLLLDEANATVSHLQKAAYLLDGVQSPARTLPANLADLAGGIASLAANVSELEDALSYERFAAAYSAAKSYVCCDLLNYAGGLWLAALLVGAAGLPTALAAFAWVARMDRLEPRGCCHVYRRLDYRQDTVAAVPELPDKREEIGENDVPGPAAGGGGAGGSAAFALSLHSKLAVMASLPRQRSDAAEEGFRIAAAPAGVAMTPLSARSAREQEELLPLPDWTPSAPAMPLSARSLPSGRGLALYTGHWASQQPSGALPPAPPPPPAPRPAASAPGSVRRGSRAPSDCAYGTAPPGLTPAALALLPPEPLEMESVPEAPTPQPEQRQEQAGQASGGTPGGRSALRRAGAALARLKLARRGGN